MAKIKERDQKAEQQKAATEQQTPFDSIQQLKPEKLLQVSPKESTIAGFISKTGKTFSWPNIQKPKSPSKSPLPPVEISVTDSTTTNTTN